jgi:tRNA(fMet)-specific endonuclease VapC
MKGDPTFVEHLKRVSRREVFLPQPVHAEIAFGIARLMPSKKKSELEQRFEAVRLELERIDWTDDVSRAFGAIKAALEKAGTPIEDFDIAIAAHALAIEATLVTANSDHMSRVAGLRFENWLEAPSG